MGPLIAKVAICFTDSGTVCNTVTQVAMQLNAKSLLRTVILSHGKEGEKKNKLKHDNHAYCLFIKLTAHWREDSLYLLVLVMRRPNLHFDWSIWYWIFTECCIQNNIRSFSNRPHFMLMVLKCNSSNLRAQPDIFIAERDSVKEETNDFRSPILTLKLCHFLLKISCCFIRIQHPCLHQIDTCVSL